MCGVVGCVCGVVGCVRGVVGCVCGVVYTVPHYTVPHHSAPSLRAVLDTGDGKGAPAHLALLHDAARPKTLKPLKP